MLIESLRPNLGREQAARILGARWRTWRRGRLRAVLDFYIPYRLFNVEARTGRRAIRMCLAIDSVTGGLDTVRFECEPQGGEKMSIDTRRSAPALTDEETARAQLRERALRLVFLNGFFRIRDFGFAADPAGQLHLPYWTGVYERGGAIEIEVLDAVRCRLEGAKVRQMAAEWFGTEDNDGRQ